MSESAGQPMRVLSRQDLLAAVAQIDQGIYNHDQWYKGLVRVLVARLPPDAADLHEEAHRRCRFGQWYDSDSTAALRGLAPFVAVGEAHRNMHASAARLLQRVEDDLPISTGDLDGFNNLLDHMRLELESLRRYLADAAQNQDPLTEVRNRASLLSDLREQHALVRRGLQECAIVMIDLDHFKDVNDTHGHATGDRVLKSVARTVQESLRSYDRLYRYGGEEFLLCCPQTPMGAAAELAQRVRAAIAEMAVPNGVGGHVQVTASLGLAALTGSQPVEDSVQRADEAMFRAKRAGRNRVEIDVRPHEEPSATGPGVEQTR